MSSLGLGLGVNRFFGRGEITPSLSTLFRQRVLEDNGTFEAQACLQDLINQGLFDNANFVLTPNGYKAGKLYALKPESGDLDVDWLRNGNASRVNQNRLIVNEAANVPRLDYLAGNCPSILVEEQTTNKVLNSDDLNASSWSRLLSNALANQIISPDGTQNADLIRSNSDTPSNRPTLQQTGANFSVGINTAFFFWKNGNLNNLDRIRLDIAGDGAAVQQLQTTINPFTGAGQESINNSDGLVFDNFKSFDLPNDWKLFVLEFEVLPEIYTDVTFRVTTDSASANLPRITAYHLWGLQLNAGRFSSYIPTSGSAVTRPADAPQPITVPTGTTEIIEALEDGTFNTITSIPTEYTIPFGRFKYILFNGA